MKNRGQRGGSMVETMIVMTLMLSVLCGIMEGGRALYTYHAVANAARLGARYAIVRGTGCTVAGCPATVATIRSYVRSQTLYVDPNALVVNPSWAIGPGCIDPNHQGQGCVVTVQVQYPFQWSIPFVPLPTLTMSSTSRMVISQ